MLWAVLACPNFCMLVYEDHPGQLWSALRDVWPSAGGAEVDGDAQHVAWVQDIYNQLKPYSLGHYINFVNFEAGPFVLQCLLLYSTHVFCNVQHGLAPLRNAVLLHERCLAFVPDMLCAGPRGYRNELLARGLGQSPGCQRGL